MKSLMVCDIQLPMDSKFLNNMKLLSFELDDKNSFSKQVNSVCQCVQAVTISHVNSNPSETQFRKIHQHGNDRIRK